MWILKQFLLNVLVSTIYIYTVCIFLSNSVSDDGRRSLMGLVYTCKVMLETVLRDWSWWCGIDLCGSGYRQMWKSVNMLSADV